MQLIHSRTTMLAREASSREEELVAMKVVELKEELGERAEALSGNKGAAAPPAARRYSERVFGERRGRRRGASRMSKIFAARLRRATFTILPRGPTFVVLPQHHHQLLAVLLAFYDPNRPNF